MPDHAFHMHFSFNGHCTGTTDEARVSCVIIISQLQVGFAFVVGPGTGRFGQLQFFGPNHARWKSMLSDPLVLCCYSFRTCKTGAQKFWWMLVVVRVRPCSNIAN